MVTILALLFGFITFLTWCSMLPFYWRNRKIPHLIPLPLFGNYFPLFTKGIGKFHKSLQNKFPGEKYYGLHFYTRPALFVKDPELIQRIFATDFEYFTSHGACGNQDRGFSACDIFHVHGQQWKALRGKLSVYFTPAKVKMMLSCAENTISKAVCAIDENIAGGKSIDFHELMLKASTDITSQNILGLQTETFTNEKCMYMKLSKAILKPSLTVKMLAILISQKFSDLINYILGEGNNDYFLHIITRTMDYRRKEKVQKQDFLQGMMELMDSETQRDQKYFPDNTRVPLFDLKTLVSQATFLFLASVDTTALTVAFLFYELSIQPDIQERCREEIASTVQKCGAYVTLAEVTKLTFLHAAIQETLRLHPPVPLLTRECTKNYKIPGSDVVIDAGTLILVSAASVHVDPRNFPEPEEFRPERYLQGCKAYSSAFLPFGSGPRTCLGMGFAYSEIKLLAARLLQRYRLSVCSKTGIPVQTAKYNYFTVPNKGIWLNVEPVKGI